MLRKCVLFNSLSAHVKADQHRRATLTALLVVGRYASRCDMIQPKLSTALSIPGWDFARSSRFMTALISTLASNARNHGSATAGISEVSVMSKKIRPVLFPSNSVK